MTDVNRLELQEHCALAPSAQEMAAFDEHTITSGVSGLTLMERVGKAIFKQLIRDRSIPALGKEIIILCGPGNNGGDALVLARFFIQAGRPPVVILCGAKKYSEDFLQNLKRIDSYKKLYVFQVDSSNPPIQSIPAIDESELRVKLQSAKLVIDGLLGTGQTGAPRGTIARVLSLLSENTMKRVVAIDVPTGINATTGAAYPGALKVSDTFTVEFHKRGLWQYPARSYVGRVTPVSVGIIPAYQSDFLLLSKEQCTSITRSVAGHKGDSGSVLVVGGSREMPGAPLLAARAALACGSGLVRLCTPGSAQSFDLLTPELLLVPVCGENTFVSKDVGYVRELLDRVSVVLIGPGMGLSADARECILRILELAEVPVVIDADALTVLASAAQNRKDFEFKPNWILTPHPGEFAKLSGQSVSEIQLDRFKAFTAFGQTHPSILVLKGAGTLVGAAGCGWIQCNGNPYLATAGTGDVLAGVIAACIAQGAPLIEAAKLGVYLHGEAADSAVEQASGGIVASDIITRLPRCIAAFRNVVT